MAVTWMRAHECVGARIDDALVLLDIEEGRYSALNPSAEAIWEALEERPASAEQLAEKLTEMFDVTVDRCLPSIERALTTMQELGLVKVAA